MKKRTFVRKRLHLSKETLTDLNRSTLRAADGGISGLPIPDSCTYTATEFTCTDVALCSCFC